MKGQQKPQGSQGRADQVRRARVLPQSGQLRVLLDFRSPFLGQSAQQPCCHFITTHCPHPLSLCPGASPPLGDDTETTNVILLSCPGTRKLSSVSITEPLQADMHSGPHCHRPLLRAGVSSPCSLCLGVGQKCPSPDSQPVLGGWDSTMKLCWGVSIAPQTMCL